ncbi:hypothetical protein G7054_g4327 [Neopestalotiopsis clavispora]|nr:hypothetical protein G7054_g4327 [Neopestalotiopsis clavispora]
MAATNSDPPTPLFWTLILIITALCLTLVVAAQIAARYSSAYMAAPREIVTFIDTIDDSIHENESYDRDVARVQRLEDKVRLGRLLREIQKSGDDLREALNGLLVDTDEHTTELRTSARILWAGHRKELEERIRRLDLLRMRFLTVYMGIIATSLSHRDKQAKESERLSQIAAARNIPPPPPLPRSLSENLKTTELMKKKPSLRRRGPLRPQRVRPVGAVAAAPAARWSVGVVVRSGMVTGSPAAVVGSVISPVAPKIRGPASGRAPRHRPGGNSNGVDAGAAGRGARGPLGAERGRQGLVR